MTPEERASQLLYPVEARGQIPPPGRPLLVVWDELVAAIRAAEQDALTRVVDIAALQATIESATAEIERLRTALRDQCRTP